jgi:hypothetical protein
MLAMASALKATHLVVLSVVIVKPSCRRPAARLRASDGPAKFRAFSSKRAELTCFGRYGGVAVQTRR